jgi:hypothetical protein
VYVIVRCGDTTIGISLYLEYRSGGTGRQANNIFTTLLNGISVKDLSL